MPKYRFSQEELERTHDSYWLSDREKEVFNLYYIREWKIEDIAAEFDVNRSTITRVLKKVRGKIMAHK